MHRRKISSKIATCILPRGLAAFISSKCQLATTKLVKVIDLAFQAVRSWQLIHDRPKLLDFLSTYDSFLDTNSFLRKLLALLHSSRSRTTVFYLQTVIFLTIFSIIRPALEALLTEKAKNTSGLICQKNPTCSFPKLLAAFLVSKCKSTFSHLYTDTAFSIFAYRF